MWIGKYICDAQTTTTKIPKRNEKLLETLPKVHVIIYDVTSDGKRSILDRLNPITMTLTPGRNDSVTHAVCQYDKLANLINRLQTQTVIDDDVDDQLSAIIQRQQQKKEKEIAHA